jgi:predicted dinucleotide-binding enzyme
MAQKQTIAIIGATGKVGSAIAKCLSVENYRLLLMADEPDKLNMLCATLKQPSAIAEIESLSCAKEASWEADIVIIATPYEEVTEVAKRIREVAIGKIVISVSQPLDMNVNAAINSESSSAEELQKLLPHSKVVKTFTTAFALSNFTSLPVHKMTESFIAGNNGEAVEIVSELVRKAGFNPVLVGDLSMSRTLERIQSKMVQETIKTKSNWLASWKMYAF